MPMRLFVQYVTVCETVYRNAFSCQCLPSYPCLNRLFLSVVSICLSVDLIPPLKGAKTIHCLQHRPVPLLECGSAVHGRCPLCFSFDMNATGIKTLWGIDDTLFLQIPYNDCCLCFSEV